MKPQISFRHSENVNIFFWFKVRPYLNVNKLISNLNDRNKTEVKNVCRMSDGCPMLQTLMEDKNIFRT